MDDINYMHRRSKLRIPIAIIVVTVFNVLTFVLIRLVLVFGLRFVLLGSLGLLEVIS
jgi:hypothetical protein